MNRTNRFLIPALALGALALPACSGSFDFVIGEDGSGVPETTSFAVESFDGIKIGNAFDARIELVDGPPTVEITVDDNFTDDLEVEVVDGRLEVNLDVRNYQAEVDHIVVITVPSLNYIDASGASQVTVEGTLTEPKLDLDASGASELRADVDTDNLDLDASGASSVTLSGAADQMNLDASGASRLDLEDLVSVTAAIDASGASTVAIGEADDINGELSGASTLRAPGDAVNNVDTSGASQIERD